MSKTLFFLIFTIFLINSCSKNNDGVVSDGLFQKENNITLSSPELTNQVVKTETQNLINKINSVPEYKIENSELDLLKSEGILTDAEIAQLEQVK